MGYGKIMNNLILKIENLHKDYNNSSVLNNFNLEIFDEDFLCILGPSGCGKTTLIRCIAGLEDYDGEITVNNKIVNKPSSNRIMVFQDFNQLFPWKTVIENVIFPLEVSGIKEKNKLFEIGNKYLEKVNLLQYKDYFPHELSGGMKQRVAIARSLAINPDMILMDEPFAALDAMTRNQMQDELLKIKEKEKMTVLFVTHNIQEAICLSNRIIVLSKNGKIKEHLYNKLEKPVTPASKGYGELWKYLNELLTGEKE